jgi:hypothetical protein
MAEDRAEIRFGASGTEDVVSAVGRIKDSMSGLEGSITGGVGKAVGAVAGQLGAMAQTALHVATALGTINIAAAVEQAKAFNEQIARMSVASGQSVADLNARFTDIRKAVGESEVVVEALASSLARVTYDFGGAIDAQKALGQEAIANGRSLAEYQQLGAVLATAGVAGKDTASVLGVLRAQAESLGVAGGPKAFLDQIMALGPALQQLSGGASAANTGFAAVLAGASNSPQMAGRVQQSVFGTMEAHAVGLSRTLGHDILDEYGHVKDPAAVAEELKANLSKRGYSERQKLIAFRNYFGNEAGSVMYHADLSKRAGGGTSSGASDAAENFVGMDEGQRRLLRLQNEANQRNSVGGLVDAQDAWGGLFSSHPMLGVVASAAAGAGIKGGMGWLGGLFGGGGAAAAGGATTAGTGGAFALSNFAANGAAAAGVGGAGTIAAAGLAALAGMFGQGAAVSSLGEDRDAMGAKWREEHAGIIAGEHHAAASRGANPLQRMIADLVARGADPKLAEATAKAMGNDLRSGAPLKVQVVSMNATPDQHLQRSRADGKGAQ